MIWVLFPQSKPMKCFTMLIVSHKLDSWKLPLMLDLRTSRGAEGSPAAGRAYRVLTKAFFT